MIIDLIIMMACSVIGGLLSGFVAMFILDIFLKDKLKGATVFIEKHKEDDNGGE